MKLDRTSWKVVFAMALCCAGAGVVITLFGARQLDVRKRIDDVGAIGLPFTSLIADLFDESGINTTGLGIGHDIEAWLDALQALEADWFAPLLAALGSGALATLEIHPCNGHGFHVTPGGLR
mgnify:CR=1 FL=1